MTRQFLLFRLYGVLASWGEIAVGEDRPSGPRPSRSAVLGLLAAALGIRRDDGEAQHALAEGYGMAVRVWRAGSLLRDYHTIQRPGPVAAKGQVISNRRQELQALERYNRQAGKSTGTILSYRDYRCDALWDVAVWARQHAPHMLEAVCDALHRPRFTLYLGRKSCPPGLPLQAQLLEGATLADAFNGADFKELWADCDDHREQRPLLALLAGKKHPDPADLRPSYFWDDDADLETGLVRRQSLTRRDHPVSRRRWQFSPRVEVQGERGEPC